MTGFSKSSESEQGHLPPERGAWPVWPWMLLLVGLVVVMLFRAGLPQGEGRAGHKHSAVGLRLTALQLEPLTGESEAIDLAALEGKVTLINFWGPWCGPCRMEFPHLVELEQHFRTDENFQFVSVSSNANPLDETGLLESTRQFLIEQKADFPTHKDPQAATTKALMRDAKMEDFGYPTTVLLGPGGAIRAVWQGYAPGDENQMRQAIETALADSQ